MDSDVSSPSSAKKRRIMIITADESIIEQLQNNNNASLFKSILLDSNDDHVEVAHTQIKNTQCEARTSHQKKGSLTCVVCGSPANGYNFDAISCESCKAFFRRNALKDPATLECRRSRNCDITNESRRRCAACRLSKCLSSGMKHDRLLTAEQKAVKLRKIQENRTLTLQANREVNEDANKLTAHVKIEEVTPELDHISTQKNTNLLLVKDLTDLLPQKPLQVPQTLLSSEDLQRVETIQLSYEQRIELAAREGLPWNPSIYATTLLEHINSRSVSVLRLISFFKQIPEFNQLNVYDRVTLIKYNLMPLAILNCTLSYNTATETIKESEFEASWNSTILLTVHGDAIYQRVKKIFESFTRIAQYDQRIIQLALIILILTKGLSTDGNSSEPILNDGLAVFRAQNYYTELLWKYLETVHGHGKAIRIFNELVVHFISWQMLQGYMARRLSNVLKPAEMNEMLPIMKSLLHIQ